MRRSDAPSVAFDRVRFCWPDHTPLLDDLTVAFGPGRTGLIGDNGSGKSTVLALIAGRLTPTSGTVTTTGSVGLLPQDLTTRRSATVAELLGVAGALHALRAIEAGSTDARHFDAVEGAWDVETRARSMLDRLGLGTVALDRTAATLSGGQVVQVALAGLQAAGHHVVLLDEPSNDLDQPARHALLEAIDAWRGALIVVSHDVELLDRLDHTAELRQGAIEVFGGPYQAFRQHLEVRRAAADQALRTAQLQVDRERQQRRDAEVALARRQRFARTDHANKRRPKKVMNQRRTEAQVSAGKLRGQLDQRLEAALEAARRRAEQVRRDPTIRLELPDPEVAARRQLVTLIEPDGPPIVIHGPRRVALRGRNGVGKTRLLEALVGVADQRPRPGGARHGAAGRGPTALVTGSVHVDRIGYLPQRRDHLDEARTIIDQVRTTARDADDEAVRADLARLGFRRGAVDRPVGELSGGERFRVALATLLLADPPHQLLVLDEPTNHIDLHTRAALVEALDAYRGGIIVVSHDEPFLAQMRIDRWLELDERGLQVVDPP